MTADVMDVDAAPLQVIALDKKDGYIWDHSEAAGLRKRCRVVSSTITALPDALRTDNGTGLPKGLSREQMRLACDKGWAAVQALEEAVPEQNGQANAGVHGSIGYSNISTVPEEMRYRVFCDLYDKGYYITAGSKFGADFLVYLGDPEQQHAVACVRIVHPDRQPCPVVLSGAARTAFGARKDLLLACVGHDLGTVHYLTLRPTAKEQEELAATPEAKEDAQPALPAATLAATPTSEAHEEGQNGEGAADTTGTATPAAQEKGQMEDAADTAGA